MTTTRRRAAGLLGVLGWLVALVVLATLVVGFLMVGGPENARREKSDEQRISGLRLAGHAVRTYYLNTKALPRSVEQIYSKGYLTANDMKDPETGASYAYRVVDKSHFELCATFETDASNAPGRETYAYDAEAAPFRKHKRGRQCFVLGAKL